MSYPVDNFSLTDFLLLFVRFFFKKRSKYTIKRFIEIVEWIKMSKKGTKYLKKE